MVVENLLKVATSTKYYSKLVFCHHQKSFTILVQFSICIQICFLDEPILGQCSISTPPENVRKPKVLRVIEMENCELNWVNKVVILNRAQLFKVCIKKVNKN